MRRWGGDTDIDIAPYKHRRKSIPFHWEITSLQCMFQYTANSIKVGINNSQIANVQYAWTLQNDGNNIVLNKINTSAALLDNKYSI